MLIDQIEWTESCCAWHGQYAEVPLRAGGCARVKRGPEVDGYLLMRYSADGARLDAGYVMVSEDELANEI